LKFIKVEFFPHIFSKTRTQSNDLRRIIYRGIGF
jgi:hypothetical protein